MNYETLTKHILHELKITNKHIAYNYIASGIYFMQLDRQCIEQITKSMYIDIAERYGTTSINVERSIRTTIEIIWKKNNYHPLLVKIFGEEYLTYRPTNTEFFKRLYAYIDFYNNAENIIKCPFLGCDHCALNSVIDMV